MKKRAMSNWDFRQSIRLVTSKREQLEDLYDNQPKPCPSQSELARQLLSEPQLATDQMVEELFAISLDDDFLYIPSHMLDQPYLTHKQHFGKVIVSSHQSDQRPPYFSYQLYLNHVGLSLFPRDSVASLEIHHDSISCTWARRICVGWWEVGYSKSYLDKFDLHQQHYLTVIQTKSRRAEQTIANKETLDN